MRAGQMRQRVDIQNPVTQTDSTGQDFFTYSTDASGFPAMVRNATQTKSEDGYIQNSGQETYDVVVRYTPLLDYNSRLVYEGLTMSVVSIVRDLELKHSMTLKCEVVDR